MSKAYHFNIVLGAVEDESLTPILAKLVTLSAAPLAAFETSFAVDSTGFPSTMYYHHFSAKHGHDRTWRDFVKLHCLIGASTNVIAAARVTGRDCNDSPEFQPLLVQGAEHVDMAEVSADKEYRSRGNVAAVAQLGATPFIALRERSKMNSAKRKASAAWSRIYHMYCYRQDEFFARHQRSNAESTFSSMQRIGGSTLFSKS